MFSARATQLRDLPPQFLAAFGAKVRTPYRIYDPRGEVIVDREGKYKGGIFTPLDVIVPETKRATQKPVKTKAPDPKLQKLLEQKKIQDAAKLLNAKTMRALQDEISDLKAKLAEDDKSSVASAVTAVEDTIDLKKDDATAIAKTIDAEEKKHDDAIVKKAVDFLITKPEDMSNNDLLKIYKKLDITGIKGSSTPVKIQIAQKFEKDTGISFKSLLGVSKSKLPSAATDFVNKFNDDIKPKLGGKKVIKKAILGKK